MEDCDGQDDRQGDRGSCCVDCHGVTLRHGQAQSIFPKRKVQIIMQNPVLPFGNPLPQPLSFQHVLFCDGFVCDREPTECGRK